ncbi:MAG TPA: alginate lyase family protein [Mariniphaga sp.]|nr:alginate lyase family protein [Mariniphaga sp.]
MARITKELRFPALKKQSILKTDTFQYLNEEHKISNFKDLNSSKIEKLWLYNLHYFDDLNSDHNEYRNYIHYDLITRWIEENPVGKGIGWDPYPISLRTVNWIKWHLNGNLLTEKAQQNLAIQIRYLRKRLEYHLLANHLFANAKALVFGGLFFEGNEAQKWLKKGLSILEKEIPEQILNDGGNFERSPMYHSIMVEDILDLINIAQSYKNPLIDSLLIGYWKSVVQKMLLWLKTMCHNDNRIALFNDSAFGIAPEYSQLSKYTESLGITPITEQKQITDLSDTGYISVKKDKYTLIIDAGAVGPDYQPGHAHADTLSFELSCDEQRIIVDSGTSCYGTGPERLRQRGTAAHNTVSVDNLNSSEVWSGFRVARRARIKERTIQKNGDSIVITASHDGFKRIRGVKYHKRIWSIGNTRIKITDIIDGSGKHFISSFLHFHPDIKASLKDNHIVELKSPLKNSYKLYLDNRLENRIIDSTYHPEFGLSIKNQKIVMAINIYLPFEFTTIIEL